MTQQSGVAADGKLQGIKPFENVVGCIARLGAASSQYESRFGQFKDHLRVLVASDTLKPSVRLESSESPAEFSVFFIDRQLRFRLVLGPIDSRQRLTASVLVDSRSIKDSRNFVRRARFSFNAEGAVDAVTESGADSQYFIAINDDAYAMLAHFVMVELAHDPDF